MDNNMNFNSYDDLLNELKTRIEILKRKCLIAEEKLEKKIVEISRLDKDIGQAERELSEYKLNIKKIQEAWRNGEIEIDKLKWTQEKASVILECNRKKNEQQLKTMDIIRRNHSNLTTCAFKTVRQETARKIINNEINNLADRKKELKNKLLRLQKTNTENEINLTQARTELNEIKVRSDTVIRLKKKFQECETFRLNAIAKLNELQIREFFGQGEFSITTNLSSKLNKTFNNLNVIVNS